MHRRELLLVASGAAVVSHAISMGRQSAQAAAQPEAGQVAQGSPAVGGRERHYLEVAEALKPELTETVQTPIALVHAVADSSLPLRWRVESESSAEALSERVLRKGDSFILDFGGHRTGYLSFRLVGVGRGVDAPVRLRMCLGRSHRTWPSRSILTPHFPDAIACG